jgi:anti-sigma regulatory factor (Ser/Thr protein kinase)/serine/threonine protein phosphatase PrpC
MALIRDNVQVLPIADESDVGTCRRRGVVLAKQTGFGEVEMGEVAIIITEMITNVLKHGGAKGVFVQCRIKDEQLNTGLEFWCCDHGVGFDDVDMAMKDGYTNKHSLGIGLGSIQRFSDEFEINPEDLCEIPNQEHLSTEQFTTHVRSRKWLQQVKWKKWTKELSIGASTRSKPGETANGDAFLVAHPLQNITLAGVIDGLGHGKEAAFASQMAKELVLANAELPIEQLMTKTHHALKGTRGITMGLLRIDTDAKKLFFCGIGNIEGIILTKIKKNSLVSYSGIVGHNMRTPRVFEHDFSKGDHVCLYSDGIISRWQYEEIDWSQTPQKNAEYIVNQFSRISDDATVLIVNYLA